MATSLYDVIVSIESQEERTALITTTAVATPFRSFAYALVLAPKALRNIDIWLESPSLTQFRRQLHSMENTFTSALLNTASRSDMRSLYDYRDFLWAAEYHRLLSHSMRQRLASLDEAAVASRLPLDLDPFDVPLLGLTRLCVLLDHPWWRCMCQKPLN